MGWQNLIFLARGRADHFFYLPNQDLSLAWRQRNQNLEKLRF
jgi:hypothetical protein